MTDKIAKQITNDRKTLPTISSKQFAKSKEKTPWLIDDILVEGQFAVIGGPKKAMKTTIAVDMALSLGSGTPFLDQFEVEERKNVVVISGESGKGVLLETAKRICQAKKIKLSECLVHWSFQLPKLSSRSSLERLGNTLEDLEADVVFIDPLYLCLLTGKANASASNLYDVGPILADLAATCRRVGATPVVLHHATKKSGGKDGGSPLQLDDLAFAGIGEFVRQWVLINRRTEFEPGSGHHELLLNVGGSAGHSSCWDVEIDEAALNSDFSGRTWNLSVSPYEHALPGNSRSQSSGRKSNLHLINEGA